MFKKKNAEQKQEILSKDSLQMVSLVSMTDLLRGLSEDFSKAYYELKREAQAEFSFLDSLVLKSANIECLSEDDIECLDRPYRMLNDSYGLILNEDYTLTIFYL